MTQEIQVSQESNFTGSQISNAQVLKASSFVETEASTDLVFDTLISC